MCRVGAMRRRQPPVERVVWRAEEQRESGGDGHVARLCQQRRAARAGGRDCA